VVDPLIIMIIQHSALAFQARQERFVTQRSTQHLALWQGERPGTERAPRAAEASHRHAQDRADTAPTHAASRTPSDRTETLPPHLQTLARMIEAITGRPVRLLDLDPTTATTAQAQPPTDARTLAPTTTGQPPAPAPQGWGLVYEATQTRTEVENLSVQAQGEIRTADGRSLSFQLSIEMQTVHTESSQISLRAGDAVLKDPLVLHFDGPLGELRNTQFSFDLDANGQAERMPFVGTGSGFLVLDRNGNGRVDDGSELFGTRSGDGFADLAQWDSDGNGWIDEADAVFKRLQVWRMDASGQTRLASLADSGVGALSVQRVGSDQSLRQADGSRLGQLRSTGLYLTESGQAKAMQQIDLAV
jgi:hypothetical protein